MNKKLKSYVCKEILRSDSFSYMKLYSKRLQDSQADAIWLLRSYLIWTQEHSHPFGRRFNRLRLERRYGIYCGNDVTIGEGLKLPHPQGIIIGKGVKLGKNVTIYQQVTLGARGLRAGEHLQLADSYPWVGDRVILYAGCKIMGSIKLTDGTVVGANAVLNRSTEAGHIYVGVPAHKVSSEGKDVAYEKYI